jgi:hypothetical protein
MPSQQELLQAIEQNGLRIKKIKERISEIDLQIKSTSVNHLDRIESELAELKNDYYEIQARELIGEYDQKQKHEIEEKIQTTEKRLKTEGGVLQDLLGVRHALEAELKKTQSLELQYQASLERVEFENLQQGRLRLVEEIGQFEPLVESLFARLTDYNINAMSLATKILTREYQSKGFPDIVRSNGSAKDPVEQLAQPFDLGQIRNSLADSLVQVASKSINS